MRWALTLGLTLGLLCSAGALVTLVALDESQLPIEWAGLEGLGAAQPVGRPQLASR